MPPDGGKNSLWVRKNGNLQAVFLPGEEFFSGVFPKDRKVCIAIFQGAYYNCRYINYSAEPCTGDG